MPNDNHIILSDADIQASLETFLSGGSDKAEAPEEDHEVEEVAEEETNGEEVSDDGHDDSDVDDDEEETDEVDDEEESDEEDEDPDEGQPELSDDDEFTITVDGEKLKLKGSELKNGYLRQSSYTKKTQEIAEERKALTAERVKVAEQASLISFQAHNRLEQMENAINQAGGWDAVKRSHSPEQIDQLSRMYAEAQRDANAADELIGSYTSQVRESNKKEIINIFTDMSKTVSGFNGNTLKQMDSYLSDNGFTEDMIMSITSRSAWDMIYKAMKYDEAQSRSAKSVKSDNKDKVEKKKHYSAPSKSSKPVNTKSRKLEKAIQEQRKSGGNTRSTEAALIALLGGK